MMRKPAPVLAIWILGLAGSAFGQFGNDWMTAGNDGQRSHWVRTDDKISPASMGKPGFMLSWKLKLADKSGSQAVLTPPSLMDFYIGYRGFRALGFFGTTSNKAIGVDTELGKVEWEKKWPVNAGAAGSAECANGPLSNVARPTNIAFPAASAFRGFGRSTPAKSGVGEPDEGAVTLKLKPERFSFPPPPKPKPGQKPAKMVNPFAPHVEYAMTVAADGKLHRMWISNGNEAAAAIPFVPANANASGLIVFDDAAYVTTSAACGGAGSGVWALDIESKKVAQWKTTAKSVVGTEGPAYGPDGTVYAAAGSELVALSPKTLETTAVFKTSGPQFTSSPVIFEYKNRSLLAVTTDDGKLQLLDTAALAKPLAASDAFTGSKIQPGALASWQDDAGTRWVLSPAAAGAGASGFASNGAVTNGAIAAFKVVERDGALALQPAWMSRDMVSPATPIVVNGVVFALDGGSGSKNAVLYALDSSTGRQLWSSGTTLTAPSKSGMSSGGSRVYVATQDGWQWAFGFPIEH
jgi:outer membrane protein assembly factor BamB